MSTGSSGSLPISPQSILGGVPNIDPFQRPPAKPLPRRVPPPVPQPGRPAAPVPLRPIPIPIPKDRATVVPDVPGAEAEDDRSLREVLTDAFTGRTFRVSMISAGAHMVLV